jgi:hypothetical protein
MITINLHLPREEDELALAQIINRVSLLKATMERFMGATLRQLKQNPPALKDPMILAPILKIAINSKKQVGNADTLMRGHSNMGSRLTRLPRLTTGGVTNWSSSSLLNSNDGTSCRLWE